MKLNETALLARKQDLAKSRAELLALCEDAGAIVLEQFAPFKKYAGSPTWRVSGAAYDASFMVRLELAFPYRDGRGATLRFSASLMARSGSSTLYTGTRAYPVSLIDEAIAAVFIESQARLAERAFEAIVLGEPWRLERIFLSC
jgi:hypothetical protein